MIELTADGSQTLRHPIFGDAYHSLRGAVGESRHVFIEAGLEAWLASHPGVREVRILEAGFGSGLNAWLTARRARELNISITYCGIELYPVSEEVWMSLEYAADPLFRALHEVPWKEATRIAEGFVLEKRAKDLGITDFDATFDLIYMDAFAPDTQPELWTQAVFEKLFEATAPTGMLVTYCAKGDVKRALRAAGYEVQQLAGALGKRHMLRACK